MDLTEEEKCNLSRKAKYATAGGLKFQQVKILQSPLFIKRNKRSLRQTPNDKSSNLNMGIKSSIHTLTSTLSQSINQSVADPSKMQSQNFTSKQELFSKPTSDADEKIY